jgi:hypothetical protein
MPIVSMFYGIKIYMYKKIDGNHHIPHIHAYYNDKDMVVALDGSIIESDLPKKQKSMVITWVLIHEEELKANHDLLEEGDTIFRIEPLR